MKDSARRARPLISAQGLLRRWGGPVIAVLAAVIALAPLPALAQTDFRPVAVVNDSAITGYDLKQRAQVMVALGLVDAKNQDLRSLALDQLIEDRLKLQAGREIGVKPTREMIEAALGELAERAKLSPAEFLAAMQNQGITGLALEDLAGAEAVWRQVVRARFANRVEPGEAEIDAEIELVSRQGSTEYRILEIGLPLVGDGRTEAQTRALARQLSDSLNRGDDFVAAVRKYSKAPSAARGGEVGWVSTARMPPDLARAVASLELGAVSGPLEVPGAVALLKLVEKRQSGPADRSDPQLRERVRQQLALRESARLAEGLLQEMRRDALIELR